ncbi:MAG: hypothetical protein RL120_04915 [Gammaproteobacteria bacterium]
MRTIMKLCTVLAALSLFSHSAMAQQTGGALKTIADIVASINHTPSDSDKAALAEIAGNDGFPEGLRDMANAVAGFNHAASDDAKADLAAIQADGQAPDRAKALAGIIASMNHRASDDDKAQLAQLFP